MIKSLRLFIIKETKRFFGIPLSQSLGMHEIMKFTHLRLGRFFYKKTYDSKDIINLMIKMGMKKGSNVFIHSSWNELYNYTGTIKEIIDGVLNVIGSQGTLAMPCFPLLRKGKTFNVKKSVTGAGLIAEEFRQYPGVRRSINVQHSVCALGPQTNFLLSEHHLGETCWDEKSPYYRISQINTLVFSIGLPRYYVGTMVHCVISVLCNDIPYFRDFFTSKHLIYYYIDVDGVEKTYTQLEKSTKGKAKRNKYGYMKKLVKKYLSKDDYKLGRISNLNISMFKANKVVPLMIDLGRKGIILYKSPSPKGYKFNK
jgi:aminoglycoside 3-N-acetyltransferase